jgi:hypothetical protein
LRVAEDDLRCRAAAIWAAGAAHLDGVGLAQQAGDQIEVGVHHVQRQRAQAKIVSLPQQRGAALDLQHLQRPIPLPGHRLPQVLISGAEPGEHVHERLPPGRPLGRHDAAGVLQSGGQRQLDEHILAGLHGAHRDVGVQPGGQADVDQVHRRVGDDGVQVGADGEAELAADRRQLPGRPAEHHHFIHIAALRVHSGVHLAEPGTQQGNLHRWPPLSQPPGTGRCPGQLMKPGRSTPRYAPPRTVLLPLPGPNANTIGGRCCTA